MQARCMGDHPSSFWILGSASCFTNTLDKSKTMKGVDAPKAWREGKYEQVCDYCLKDAQLTYDVYQYGKENGILKSRSFETGDILEVEVEW